MDYVWIVMDYDGLCMDYVWIMVDYVWIMYGLCMLYVCYMYVIDDVCWTFSSSQKKDPPGSWRQVHLAAQSQRSLAEDVFQRLDELEQQVPGKIGGGSMEYL